MWIFDRIKKLFVKDQYVETPKGKVEIKWYLKNRFISVRQEIVEGKYVQTTLHYNCFDEMFKQTFIGRWDKRKPF